MKWEYIKDHPRLILILRYAKLSGRLRFSPQSLEIQEEDKENHIPKREGFYCDDINGFWLPDSFKTYIQGNIENFKEAYNDFGFFAAFKFLSLKVPWSGWAWVVESKSTVKHEIAMVKWRQLKKSDKHKYDDLVKAVCPLEVNAYLKENYIQLSPACWVGKKDPSVIIFDEELKPFALKDGWSTAQLGEIFEHWYECIVEEKIKAEFVLESNW